MFRFTETGIPVFTSKTPSTGTIIPDPDQTTTLEMRTDLAAQTATDTSGGNRMVSSRTHDDSESTYALGITNVTYTAVDGNSVTKSVNISTKGRPNQ